MIARVTNKRTGKATTGRVRLRTQKHIVLETPDGRTWALVVSVSRIERVEPEQQVLPLSETDGERQLRELRAYERECLVKAYGPSASAESLGGDDG